MESQNGQDETLNTVSNGTFWGAPLTALGFLNTCTYPVLEPQPSLRANQINVIAPSTPPRPLVIFSDQDRRETSPDLPSHLSGSRITVESAYSGLQELQADPRRDCAASNPSSNFSSPPESHNYASSIPSSNPASSSWNQNWNDIATSQTADFPVNQELFDWSAGWNNNFSSPVWLLSDQRSLHRADNLDHASTPPPPSARPAQAAFGVTSPLLGGPSRPNWNLSSSPSWLSTSTSPSQQPPPTPILQTEFVVPILERPPSLSPRSQLTNLFPANRSSSSKSHSWRQTPRKTVNRPQQDTKIGNGYGFAVTAARAVRKATKTTKLKKGGRKQACGTQTRLRYEYKKKVRFTNNVLVYEPPIEESGDFDEKRVRIWHSRREAGPTEEDQLDDIMLLDEKEESADTIMMDETEPSLPAHNQRFDLQSLEVGGDKKESVFTNKNLESHLFGISKATNTSAPALLAAVDPQPAFDSPFYPLIEEALASKGPLDDEAGKLIVSILTDMEEEYEETEDDRETVWNETADEFCGCTCENLWEWYDDLKLPIEAQENTSERVMALLLRAFFDNQFSLMDEIACMEDVGLIDVSKELIMEKKSSVRGFLSKAKRNLERALWSYLLSEWMKD